nr:acyltransferase [Enterobacter hormaechei]
MTISELLKRNNNNLDFIRIVLAVLVIVGHSYFLADASGKTDPINSLFGFTYSGSLAVKVFFFISGMLVTNSLMRTQSSIEFIISRFFRIYPAFFVTIIASAYIVGPLVTDMSIGNYMSSKWLDYYVNNNLMMNINYNLPGVFGNNLHRLAVNGSIWTIPYEIYSYVVLLSVFMLGAFKNKIIFNCICLIVILAPVLGYSNVLFIDSNLAEVYMLPPCFALGALFAANQNKIKVTAHLPIGFFILHLFIKDNTLSILMFYFSMCTLALYISGLSMVILLKIKYDISYGVYLWGFVVQQVMYHFLPNININLNQAMSIITSCILGYASYKLVELPCMSLGKRITKFNTYRRLKDIPA